MIPSHLDFKNLKRRVSIADVLIDKGLRTQYRNRGNKLTGPCPVHGGDNPRAFVVDLTRNIWHCFTGCNTGGDLIEFVRRMDGKSYRQIAEYLAGLAVSQPVEPNTNIYSSVKKTFRPFKKKLPLDPHTSWFRKKGIYSTTALRFETGAYCERGFLEECIGVRLHDLRGQPLGYAGRRMNPLHIKTYGKWKFPTGLAKASLLYNFHRVQHTMKRGLAVVECPWAVMRLSQLSIPAVSLLGTNLSLAQLPLLLDADRIILMLDGDRAGKNAMNRIKAALAPHVSVRSFILPNNLDPDDLNDDELKKVSHLLLS